MARIRTLKPEFWTDEKIVALSYETRLFFQGMWNFADDCGHIENEPLRLKLQILPNDPVDATEQIKALVDAGLVEKRSGCLLIPNFGKHQRIDKESRCRFSEDSTKPLRGRREPSSTPRKKKPRKGREGKGEEWKGRENSPNGLSDESARKPTDDQTWVNAQVEKLAPLISSGEVSTRQAFEDIFNFAFEANGKGPSDPLNAAKFILVAYLRAVEGRAPRRDEWPLMGKLVKEYGKRSFTGFAEAIAKTPEDWFRYARGVLREKAS